MCAHVSSTFSCSLLGGWLCCRRSSPFPFLSVNPFLAQTTFYTNNRHTYFIISLFVIFVSFYPVERRRLYLVRRMRSKTASLGARLLRIGSNFSSRISRSITLSDAFGLARNWVAFCCELDEVIGVSAGPVERYKNDMFQEVADVSPPVSRSQEVSLPSHDRSSFRTVRNFNLSIPVL